MWITALLGTIGAGIKGLFGFKGKQADTLQKAMDVINNAANIDQAQNVAAAQIIMSEINSPHLINSEWRSMLMVVFAGIVIARWWGYMPPNMTPAEIMEVYGILKMGVGGYIGHGIISNIVRQMNLGSVIKKFIEKKLV